MTIWHQLCLHMATRIISIAYGDITSNNELPTHNHERKSNKLMEASLKVLWDSIGSCLKEKNSQKDVIETSENLHLVY